MTKHVKLSCNEIENGVCRSLVLRKPPAMTEMPKYDDVFQVMGRTSTPLEYARQLAITLWEKHYKVDSPDWEPLPDLIGLLTQIDNMTCGLVRDPSN